MQGVGAKVALGILSALSPKELVTAIAAGDRTGPDAGARCWAQAGGAAADRIARQSGGMPTGAVALPALPPPAPGGVVADVLSALANLGYRRAEALPAVERAMAAEGEDVAGRRAARQFA